MSNILFLKIDPSGDVAWWEQGESSVTYGKEDALGFKAKGRKVVGILPAEYTVRLPFQVTAKSPSQIRAAVPYALEEQLLMPVEDLHFAIESRQVDDYSHAWVVEDTVMQAVKEWLKEHRIAAEVLLPEVALLYSEQQQLSLWNDEQVKIAHDGTVVTGNSDTVEILLQDIVAQTDPDHLPLHCAVLGEDVDMPLVDGLLYQTDMAYQGAYMDISENFTLPAQVNLFQGEYKATAPLVEKSKPWWLTMGLAASLFALYVGSLWFENKKLEAQVQSVNKSINDVYRQAFPQSKVVNAKTQMQQKLSALSGVKESEKYSDLVAGASKALLGKVEIVSFSYRPTTVQFAVKAKKIDSLEKVVQDIQQQGYEAQMKSVSSQKDSVSAKLEVSPKIKGGA